MWRRILGIAILILSGLAVSLEAQTKLDVSLLPDGTNPPASEGSPRALVHLPPHVTGDPATAAIVICPGGGYGGLAMDHEGTQIAQWVNSLGMAAIICQYRHRGDGVGHPVPLQDAQRAIRLARAHANEWNIDPQRVGILGFSAGGHLASTVLTRFDVGNPSAKDPVARQSSRPDVGILCYPVIGFGKPYTHGGSQKNLLGDGATPAQIQALSNEEQVTAETPPTFLWHTYEDEGVVPENSVRFYLAMLAHHVPGELHVFEKGVHGVGLAGDVAATRAWPELCENWLRTRGFVASTKDVEAQGK